jgi:hypothetical protein
MRPIVTLSVPKRQELKPDSGGDMMGVFKKKYGGNGDNLQEYDCYENGSEYAFSGFVAECYLRKECGGTSTSQRQQMQHNFRDAGVAVHRSLLVGAVHHKGRQIDADKVGIEKMDLQKIRQQKS